MKNYFFALLFFFACCKSMEHTTGRLPSIREQFPELSFQLPPLNSETSDILAHSSPQLLSLACYNRMEQTTDSMEEDTEQPDQILPSIRKQLSGFFTQTPPLNPEPQDILAHRTYLAPYVEASYNYSLEETPNYQVQTPQVNEIPSPTEEQLTIIRYIPSPKSPNTLAPNIPTPKSAQQFYCALGCGVFSFWRKSIKLHELAHIDEKRIRICDEPNCHAAFSDNSALTRHKNMHRPTLRCRFQGCNRTFARKDNRINHEETHKKRSLQKSLFKCLRCRAKFTIEGDYNRHNKQRHKENGFQCIRCCKKLFHSKGKLCQHYNKKIRKGILKKCDGKIIVA